MQTPTHHPTNLASNKAHADNVRHVPLESTTLLGAHGQIDIRHNGEIYKLRRTKLGKLILTK